MRKPATAIALVLATCGTAAAQTPPLAFSFVPQIHQSTPVDLQCQTPLGAGWFNYLSNRGTVTSIFPTFLGAYNTRNWFTGPICFEFAAQDPRWPTGHVLIWLWGRSVSNHILANAYQVSCLENKLARRFTGQGYTVDEVIESTVSVNDAASNIGNAAPGTYATSVCRLLEMFYPGRGAWYEYPQ
jgi:hypothetical protein